MLRVTLNSYCVQFASEIERTDVFLVKIINNMCSVILFSRLFAIFISRVWKKNTKYYPSKMFPRLCFNELPVNIASVNYIQAFCSLQPQTKIVGKVENERLDFNNISIDLIYRYTQSVYEPPSTPYQC